jgi:predicted neuraminidase
MLWSAAGVPAALLAHADSLERFTLPAPAGCSVCAYPSVARLDGDRLMCVYSALVPTAQNKISLFATFSEDHGGSWSDPAMILATPGGQDYDSSIIVVGRRVIVSSTVTPLNDDTISSSRTMAVRSDDGGQNWSAPYEIPMGRRYTSGKTNNGIVLADGTALLGYTWEKNLEIGPLTHLTSEGQMEEVNAVLMSFDEGRTWTSSQSVELTSRKEEQAVGAINGVCEPALIECDDGSIFMLSRTGLTNLYGSRSYDGGRSWTEPAPTPLVGHNAPAALCGFGGPRSGALVVWNNSPTDRWPLSVAASIDGCRTWTKPRDIALESGVESSYPCCTSTADGKLLVVYQQFHKGGRDIRGVKFDPAWMFTDDAALALPQDAEKELAAAAPEKLGHFTSMPKPVVLQDGTWALYFIDHEGPGLAPTPAEQYLYVRYSKDQAKSWSEAERLLNLPSDAGGFGYFVPLIDKDGEVHLFMLCDAGTGAVRPRPADSGQPPYEPLARQRLDVWHVRSSNQGKTWPSPECIWEGRAGDLQSVTQLHNGRIVLPLSYFVDRTWSNRGDGPAAYTFTGQFDVTAIYSDDNGQTWQRSPSVLRTATPDLASYGAVEPVVLQLNDGRVWMLLRTQLGRFYESFSDNGAEWSAPVPSEINSSDSPAGLARLPDDQILLLWNNCQRHPYAQGSRHVLHAALSDDDGKTWRGYREVVRDPYRDSPPPPSGDHGVSYPFLAVDVDGSVLFSLWVETGEGRSLWRLDPAWLTENRAHADFSSGLDQWSHFGARGVSLAADPAQADAKVLALQKVDLNWRCSAVWNFPAAGRARLRTRVFFETDAPRLGIELSGHFSPPADEQSRLYSLFDCQISRNDDIAADAQTASGRWADVELVWDCRRLECKLLVDGAPVSTIAQRHADGTPSYVRFTLDDQSELPGRVLIDRIDVEAAAHQAARMQWRGTNASNAINDARLSSDPRGKLIGT